MKTGTRQSVSRWSEAPQGLHTVEEAHHVWTGGSPQNPTRFYIVPTISGVVHTVYYRAKLAAGGRGKEKYILKFRTRQEAEEHLESLGIQPIREGEEVVGHEAPIEHSFQQPPSLQGAAERVRGEEHLESLGIQPIREGEEVVGQEASTEHSCQQPPSLQGAAEKVRGEEHLESLGIQPIREGEEEEVEQEASIEHSCQQPPSLQGAVERVLEEEFENDRDADVDRAAVSYLANAMTERFSLLEITIQDHETISRMSEFPDDTPEVVLPAVDRYNDPQNVIENMPQQLP